MRICVVCSGNICRSPFVEHVLKREVGAACEVFSAGTLGIDDHGAYGECVSLAPRYGLDLSDHTSRGLDRELVSVTDFFLCMSKEHGRDVVERFGAHPKQIVLLGDFLPDGESIDLGVLGKVRRGDDLPDPVGLAALEIRPLLDALEQASVAFAKTLLA